MKEQPPVFPMGRCCCILLDHAKAMGFSPKVIVIVNPFFSGVVIKRDVEGGVDLGIRMCKKGKVHVGTEGNGF